MDTKGTALSLLAIYKSEPHQVT